MAAFALTRSGRCDIAALPSAKRKGRSMMSAASSQADALIVFDEPLIWSLRTHLVAMADKTRLPTIYGYSEFVIEGGLVSYGPLTPDLYRRTASYVDKILRGTKPVNLPIERPTKFELMVNRKTANALGLRVPQSILISADRILE